MTSAITSVEVLKDFSYERLHSECILVSTRITVKCQIPSDKHKIELHPLSLPFGLLDRISITSSGGTAFACTIEVLKTTGRVQSDTMHNGSQFALTYKDSKNNQDAADEDLRTVRDRTGHIMKSRMIAGASVARVLVTFSEDVPPPPEFFIHYYGANVLPTDTDITAARLPFQLPPLTAQARVNRNKPAAAATPALEL